MLCCLAITLLSGNLAAGAGLTLTPRRARGASRRFVMVALAGAAALLTPAAIAHAGHYAQRAKAHERTVLEEMLAQPLCTGGDANLKVPE